jgi:hypothetical protein
MIKNDQMAEENVYSRWITLSGQCEESWIKTPFRTIEAVELNDPGTEGKVFDSGIKILSKAAPLSIDAEDDVWVTIDEE